VTAMLRFEHGSGEPLWINPFNVDSVETECSNTQQARIVIGERNHLVVGAPVSVAAIIREAQRKASDDIIMQLKEIAAWARIGG